MHFQSETCQSLHKGPKFDRAHGLHEESTCHGPVKRKWLSTADERVSKHHNGCQTGPLTKKMVEELPYKGCVGWCKALRLPTKKTVAEMRADLLKLFENKPDNHHINH